MRANKLRLAAASLSICGLCACAARHGDDAAPANRSSPAQTARDAGGDAESMASAQAGAPAAEPVPLGDDGGSAGAAGATPPMAAASDAGSSGLAAIGGCGGGCAAAAGGTAAAAGAAGAIAGAGAGTGAAGAGAIAPNTAWLGAGRPVPCTTDADCRKSLYTPVCGAVSRICEVCPDAEQERALALRVDACILAAAPRCLDDEDCRFGGCITSCDAL
jgi:hypothetical protein